ncbi:hypothetical protein BJ546DRAFT_1071018 [Cryomyces antarcticus]
MTANPLHPRHEVMHTAMGSSFNNGKYSDLTIRCNDEAEYQVHKIIVCNQSAVLDALCKGPFLEATMKTIDLEDDLPYAIRAMLNFMYRFEYGYDVNRAVMTASRPLPASIMDNEGATWANELTTRSAEDIVAGDHAYHLLFHVQVYTLADKYDVTPLKRLSRDKFATLAKTFWDAEAFEFAIRAVYNITPSHDQGMRDAVVNVSGYHIEEMKKDRAWFSALIHDIPEFGADLVSGMSDMIASPFTHFDIMLRCPRCRQRGVTELCPNCHSQTWDHSDLGPL